MHRLGFGGKFGSFGVERGFLFDQEIGLIFFNKPRSWWWILIPDVKRKWPKHFQPCIQKNLIIAILKICINSVQINLKNSIEGPWSRDSAYLFN